MILLIGTPKTAKQKAKHIAVLWVAVIPVLTLSCTVFLRKKPLVAFSSSFCCLLTLGFLLSVPFLLCAWWCFFAKKRPVAFFHVIFGGLGVIQRVFNSSLIRAPLVHTPSVSGGYSNNQSYPSRRRADAASWLFSSADGREAAEEAVELTAGSGSSS